MTGRGVVFFQGVVDDLLAAKVSVLLPSSILYVHLRGKARLPVLRQFVNHSALFAP